MLTLDIGPLALATNHLLLLGSLLLATLAGWWSGRRQGCNPERQLFRLLLLGLLVARLAFVLVYAELYRAAPWRVLDIRDGGFLAWPGLLAALALGAWYLWRDARLRRPLATAMALGLAWPAGWAAARCCRPCSRAPGYPIWPCRICRGVRSICRISPASRWWSTSGPAGARPVGARCRCWPPRSATSRG